jgi:hypothetical protein
MLKGIQNNWESYPIYPPEAFEPLKQTFSLFPKLFKADFPTPMDDFLNMQFPNQNIWQPLRNNFKTEQQFVKACHQKIDGLRTLQFLRSLEKTSDDNENLLKNLRHHCGVELADFQFENAFVETLDAIRNLLFEKEQERRKADYKTVKIFCTQITQMIQIFTDFSRKSSIFHHFTCDNIIFCANSDEIDAGGKVFN